MAILEDDSHVARSVRIRYGFGDDIARTRVV